MRVGLGWLLGLALVMAFGSACRRASADREYPLQGQVIAVSADHLQATIKHEAIPGLMQAMTMPYKVRDAQQFASLEPGDLISATLVIVSNDGFLKDVRKVGEAPLEKPADGAPSAASGSELLKPGDRVPNATFVDQDGRRREFASFRDRTVVVTFIYTRCPMPTFCPLMDRHFRTIQEKLEGDRTLKGVHLLSVSFDPIVDTPPMLKKHAATLGADSKYWTFLTGDRDEIDKFAGRLGVVVIREANDQRDISHNLRTAIVDGSGTLVKAYTGNEWTPDQLLADLRHVAPAN